MNIKIVEFNETPPGEVVVLLSPEDYIDYKEYMKTKEEYEEKLKVVSGLASILDDPFFNDEV